MNIRARNHVCTAAFVVAADTCPSLPLARSLQALWCACRRLGASGVASCTSILLARVSILFTLAMASPTTTIWVTLHYTHLSKLSFLFQSVLFILKRPFHHTQVWASHSLPNSLSSSTQSSSEFQNPKLGPNSTKQTHRQPTEERWYW